MLKGTLDDFTLPDIFRLMSLAKKTGRMDVSRGAGQGRVFFNEGDVYYAESSLSREPLGQKLIRARALTESQLNKALDTHAQTGKRVGDIMIESGMVTSDQIEAAVAQQIEDAVFDLLRWDLGEFTWEAGAELEVEVPISVSVENLIMEASRRLDELEVIQRKIPGEHAVLAMAHTPPEGAAEINITPEEWRALVLVDGSRTLGEIGQMIGKDDFETMKILYGLVSAGLVEVDHEASAEAAEAAEREPAEDEVAGFGAEAPEAEVLEVGAEAEDVTEADVVIQAEEPALEDSGTEPEVEVVVAEPAEAQELEDVLAEAPAVEAPPPPEAEPATTEVEAEAGAEDATAAEAGAEVVDIGSGAGVAGDEALDEGAFDMTGDDLLAPESTEPEVDIPAVSNGAADLMDVPAEVREEVAMPDFADAGTASIGDEEATAETVSVGDAEDPFLSDLLDQDATEEAPEEVTPPTAEPAAEEEVPEEVAPEEVAREEEVPEEAVAMQEAPEEAEPEDSPKVDRAAVVRELAGLFDEDRPKARPSGPSAPPAPGAPAEDQRKRVEDDDQINKGVISRLIKGVKGL